MHLLKSEKEIKEFIVNLTFYLPQINVKTVKTLPNVINKNAKACSEDVSLNENFNELIKIISTIPQKKVTISIVSEFFLYYEWLIKNFNLTFHPQT